MNLIKKTLLSLAFILIIVSSGFCQLDNNIFLNDLKLKEQDSSKLLFNLSTLNYLRNTEYFGPIEAGKTLFGYHIKPSLTYYPFSFMRMDLGGFFRKDFGNEKFKLIAPVFSIKLAKNGYAAIFGNYEAALSHKLIEPLFNIEYGITRPLEQGFQFKIDKKKLWSDTWIDWRKMIYTGSPFKEELAVGNSSILTVMEVEDKFKTEILLQALVRHVGGQIDALRTTPLSTQLNTAAGLRFTWAFNDSEFLKKISTEGYFINFSEQSSRALMPYQKGKGFYVNFYVKTNTIGIMSSYWNANNYNSYDGTSIFQSVNMVDIGQQHVRIPQRSLLFLRLFYEKQIVPDLLLDVRFEPFYEFSRRKIDYSYSVYLRYNLSVKLNK
jgi:hypothetical protein